MPPIGGPSTGATRIGAEKMLTMRIRSRLGAIFIMIMLPTGPSTAPATPCSMRAAINCGRLWQMPHRTEAKVKPSSAITNKRRAPMRSASQPLAGSRMALAIT